MLWLCQRIVPGGTTFFSMKATEIENLVAWGRPTDSECKRRQRQASSELKDTNGNPNAATWKMSSAYMDLVNKP